MFKCSNFGLKNHLNSIDSLEISWFEKIFWITLVYFINGWKASNQFWASRL